MLKYLFHFCLFTERYLDNAVYTSVTSDYKDENSLQ